MKRKHLPDENPNNLDNPDSLTESLFFKSNNDMVKLEKEKEQFDFVFKFLYINQAYITHLSQGINLGKDSVKKDVIESYLVTLFKQRSNPGRALKDFQSVFSHGFEEARLSKLLSNSKSFTENLYNFLKNDDNQPTIQACLDNFYNDKPALKDDRQKKILLSKSFIAAGPQEIKNFLYVNARFFYAPFVDNNFQDWVKKQSYTTQKELFTFSNNLRKAIINSDSPSKIMYGIDGYKAALSSLINDDQRGIEFYLNSNRALYETMKSVFANNMMKSCINQWYVDHATNGQDDRIERKNKIELLSSQNVNNPVSNENKTPVKGIKK